MSISPPSRKWKKPILPEGASLTFADYFKLNADTEEVLACFGYSYLLADCRLPHSDALDHDRLRDVTHLAIELVALDQWADDRTETRF